MPKPLFQTAVKLRIGAPVVDDCILCPRCSNAILDRAETHCLTCALPQATRGHYAVRDDVLALAHLADPSADTETTELIPNAPTLRPADILTSAAIPGRLAALDIAVTSPDASGAGIDCCASMYDSKLRKYADHLQTLLDQNIVYKPLVFSAYGRAHPETEVILSILAQRAARRRGLYDHRALLRRACAAIGVSSWRRAATMVQACLPRLSLEKKRLLFSDGRALA